MIIGRVNQILIRSDIDFFGSPWYNFYCTGACTNKNLWRNGCMENYELKCPYCGGKDLIECGQFMQGAISPASKAPDYSQPLYHLVCKKCGTVVRSYVKMIEYLNK